MKRILLYRAQLINMTEPCYRGSHQCLFCDSSFEQIDKLAKHNEIHMNGDNFQQGGLHYQKQQFVATENTNENQDSEITSSQNSGNTSHELSNMNEMRILSSSAIEDKHSAEQLNRSSKNISPSPEDQNTDYYTCGACNKTFTEMARLEVHLMICAAEKYECNKCGKLMTTREEQREHRKVHENEKRHACDICGVSFKLAGTLTQHMILHTGLKPYECKMCQKTFSQRSHLWKHRKTHTEDRPYVCPICGKSFRQGSFMPIHIRTHTKEKPYKCEHCDKSFASSTQLTKHRRTHTGEKNYPCLTCGKAFSSPNSLKIHVRGHTGYKPYSCDYCDMTFASKSHQISHVRSHTGEKPFKCDLCSKSFGISSHLTRHKLTHSGEKAFKCGICQRSFATSYYLQIHIAKHSDPNSLLSVEKQCQNSGTYVSLAESSTDTDSLDKSMQSILDMTVQKLLNKTNEAQVEEEGH